MSFPTPYIHSDSLPTAQPYSHQDYTSEDHSYQPYSSDTYAPSLANTSIDSTQHHHEESSLHESEENLPPNIIYKSVNMDSYRDKIFVNESDRSKINHKFIHTFYGDSSLMVFFRYLQILLTRLYQAQKFSIKVTYCSAEDVVTRYKTFMKLLVKLMLPVTKSSSIGSFTKEYEDNVRKLFGPTSYIFYHMDLLFSALSESLINVLQHDLPFQLAQLYLSHGESETYMRQFQDTLQPQLRSSYRIQFSHNFISIPSMIYGREEQQDVTYDLVKDLGLDEKLELLRQNTHSNSIFSLEIQQLN